MTEKNDASINHALKKLDAACRTTPEDFAAILARGDLALSKLGIKQPVGVWDEKNLTIDPATIEKSVSDEIAKLPWPTVRQMREAWDATPAGPERPIDIYGKTKADCFAKFNVMKVEYPDGSLHERRVRKPTTQEFTREVEVTEEMIAACRDVFPWMSEPTCGRAYRAMHAVAPVELCPEDRIAELEKSLASQKMLAQHFRERHDADQEAVTNAHAGWAEATKQRDGWEDRANRLSAAYDDAMNGVIERNGENADLRSELMEARDALARFTAANVAEASKPKHNPFREFGGDRRRIGG